MTPVEEAIAALATAEWHVAVRAQELAERHEAAREATAALVKVRQALSRLRADGEGWRPIEEAPRDGAYIDIWRSRPHADVALGHRVPEVCWVANPENWIEPESPPGWYLEHDEEPLERVDGPEWKVSHFRPLPAPPEGGE